MVLPLNCIPVQFNLQDKYSFPHSFYIVVSLLSVSYDYLDLDAIAKTWEHRHVTTIKST